MPRFVSGTIGRYELQRSIGAGGMGALYLARDPAIDRLVAIKVLREGLDNDDIRERFTREARAAGRLRHPNIVTIFDVGEDAGVPFIAMEYLAGETLAELIRRRAALATTRKLQIVEDLCSGLHYAHRAGVIHRDIKPANVMVDEDGIVKVLDFGIARAGASGMTQGIIGTLNYMAPEQMEGKAIDARVDIYAVGALFYELLTYQRAFPGDISDGILARILAAQPEPVETLVPQLDSGIVAIVNRCLEKNPDLRYPDCPSLQSAIVATRQRIQEAGGDALERSGAPMGGEGVLLPTPKSARRANQRVELLRVRAEQIRQHVERANVAFSQGAFEDALSECDQALVLDPEHAEASDLSDKARVALEEAQIRQWVVEGTHELQQGSLTAASILVDRALSLNSLFPDAITLRQAVDEARRDVADQARTQRLADTVESAEAELARGDFERALEIVDRIVAVAPSHHPALQLKARIAAARAARQFAEESKAQAQAISEKALKAQRAAQSESAKEFSEPIRQFDTAVLPAGGPKPIDVRRRSIPSQSQQAPQRAGRTRTAWVVAAAALALAIAVASFATWRRQPVDAANPVTSTAPPAAASAAVEPPTERVETPASALPVPSSAPSRGSTQSGSATASLANKRQGAEAQPPAAPTTIVPGGQNAVVSTPLSNERGNERAAPRREAVTTSVPVAQVSPPPVQKAAAPQSAEPQRPPAESPAAPRVQALATTTIPMPPSVSPPDEDSAIRQVLQRYQAAYESLEANAVKAIYPAINATALAAVFNDYVSLKQQIDIDRIQIGADGLTATVSGQITTAPVVKKGRATAQRGRAVFTLRKSGGSWLIESVRIG